MFTEVIRPGAFKRAITQDVRLLFNHDNSVILGRTASGTLRLENRAEGLWFDVDLPNTTAARDIAESIRRGDLDACSFAFLAIEDKWTGDTRELIDVDVSDVSLVTYPAYTHGTSVAMRCNELYRYRNKLLHLALDMRG